MIIFMSCKHNIDKNEQPDERDGDGDGEKDTREMEKESHC